MEEKKKVSTIDSAYLKKVALDLELLKIAYPSNYVHLLDSRPCPRKKQVGTKDLSRSPFDGLNRPYTTSLPIVQTLPENSRSYSKSSYAVVALVGGKVFVPLF
jgi:hypothetical protein